VTSPEITPDVITRAYGFALDPTPSQVSSLRSHIGGSRFAYNTLLELVKENQNENREKQEAGYELARDDWIDASHFGLLYLWAEHRDELAPWWAENGSSTYNDAAQRLSRALLNFDQGRAGFPIHKRKAQGGSVRFMRPAVRLTDSHHVRIARIGEIKTYESTRKLFRHLERGTGRIVAATVSQRLERWKVSFTVEVTRVLPQTRPPDRVIGVDVGVITLYTGATSDGQQILQVGNPRHFQSAEKKLAHVQRVASRRQGPRVGAIPSKRWRKANNRVQNIHSDLRNARGNLIHETTSFLAKNFDVIVIENLNVAGLIKNHYLAKHITDAA
jgi:putative transposase